MLCEDGATPPKPCVKETEEGVATTRGLLLPVTVKETGIETAIEPDVIAIEPR